MYILLTSTVHLEVQGKMQAFAAGDWIDVGKQYALYLISEGKAKIPKGMSTNFAAENCGVLGLREEPDKAALGTFLGKLDCTHSREPAIPFEKTLIWDNKMPLRQDLIPIGFHLLDTWEVASPLWDYEKIANELGSEEERDRTQKIVRDLRVPVYTPGLIYIKNCERSRLLIDTWKTEHLKGDDRRLSLLRAIYLVKPLILALPTTWLWKDMA